jgi:hypothetical protein
MQKEQTLSTEHDLAVADPAPGARETAYAWIASI